MKGRRNLRWSIFKQQSVLLLIVPTALRIIIKGAKQLPSKVLSARGTHKAVQAGAGNTSLS